MQICTNFACFGAKYVQICVHLTLGPTNWHEIKCMNRFTAHATKKIEDPSHMWRMLPIAGPGGTARPSTPDYRRVLRKPFTARIEPTYISGRLVPPEMQAVVGLDQFRAQHLRPLLRCSDHDLRALVPWRVSEMPPLRVTLNSLRVLVRKARRSTPFRDLIEYCMIEWLADTEL